MNDKTEQSLADELRCTAAGGHAEIINVPGYPLMVRAVDYNALRAEKDRLTACLEKANVSAEHFEREWYLRGDEIDTLRAQLAEAQAALKTVMRNAELSKEPCSPDPDSPAAVRNAKFASLSSIAAQGLGMVSGPSLTAQLAEAQRDAEVSKQINRACAELPDDFRIAIELERNAACVYLLQEDEDIGSYDPCEGIARSISAAIDAAKGESNG